MSTATVNGKATAGPIRYVAFYPDGIPAELRALERSWALTKLVRGGDGGIDKPPFRLGLEHHADSTDPRTLSRFEAVHHAILSHPGEPLLPAFAITGDGMRTVLDLDDCLEEIGPVRDEDDYQPIDLDDLIAHIFWNDHDQPSGDRRRVATWAARIVYALDSLAQVSTTGTGLRIIVRGTLPVASRKVSNLNGDGTGSVEFMADKRFATFTGQGLEGFGTINDRQEELDALFRDLVPEHRRRPDDADDVVINPDGFPERSDEEVLRLARDATYHRKYGPKWHPEYVSRFAKLERGDDSDFNGDRSSADWYFWRELFRYAGPRPDQVERVARKTMRARSRADKWSDRERRGKKTWMRYDIDNRLATMKAADYWGGPGGDDAGGGPDDAPAEGRPEFCNYVLHKAEQEGEKDRRIPIDQPDLIIKLNLITGGWPRRVGGALFAHDGGDADVVQFTGAEQLMAWVGGKARLSWSEGASFVPQRRFYEALRQTVPQYDAIERHPHFPPIEGVYYACAPAVVRHADGMALERLLDLFSPATPADRELIRAFVLTLFWGGPPGKRPMFLAEGPEGDPFGGRGVGKSELFSILAGLAGGAFSNISTRDDITAITKRIVNDRARRRCVLFDNVKAERFSWGDLEGMITGPAVGGHMLYIGDESRPNLLTYCMTINGASLSEDLAQRTVMIRLDRPKSYDRGGEAWSDVAARFVAEHRAEIIADIAATFDRPAAKVEAFQRWASWTHAVLARCNNPITAQLTILERQEGINDDRAAANEFGRFLALEIEGHFGRKASELVAWISSDALVPIVARFTEERITPLNVSKKINRFRPRELTKKDRTSGKGWLWVGKEADAASDPEEWIHATATAGANDGSRRL